MIHPSPTKSWSFIFPWVLSASMFGTVSPMVKPGILNPVCLGTTTEVDVFDGGRDRVVFFFIFSGLSWGRAVMSRCMDKTWRIEVGHVADSAWPPCCHMLSRTSTCPFQLVKVKRRYQWLKRFTLDLVYVYEYSKWNWKSKIALKVIFNVSFSMLFKK